MHILITGAGGFVGRYLAKELTQNGHKVTAFDRAYGSPLEYAAKQIVGNILDQKSIAGALTEKNPDACVHLAAITFVPSGEIHPNDLFSINLTGTINLLATMREYSPATRTLVISSAHVYGNVEKPTAFVETDPLRPTTLYAISKAAAEMFALSYANQHNIPVMAARPGNHTGPGQSPQFVVPAFAKQVAAIAAGKTEPVIHVGNIDSKRHFTDVRDVVRAYRLILEKGSAGSVYNISSPQLVSVRDILNSLCNLGGISPKLIVDADKYRPTDCSPALDTSKAEKELGWQAEIKLETTLKDMLAEQTK
ncbi:MAG: GDP-mannose 4,6-dehydratase [Lentisphaerae bacterium]|nr:GDP-mannose 4,6-dehydratase [Lentisphaerota bacterium]